MSIAPRTSMEIDYKKRIKNKYPEFYRTIRKSASSVSDQRTYKHRLTQSDEKYVWDPWEELYIEYRLLKKFKSRGDVYDEEIFDFLENLQYRQISHLLLSADIVNITKKQRKIGRFDVTKEIKNQFQYHLRNFFATYPTISYILIDVNKLYPLAIAGQHPIIIDEIANSQKWLELSNTGKGHRPGTGLPPLEEYSSYASLWSYYGTNKSDIEILLKNVEDKEIDLYLLPNSILYNNKILFNVLWSKLPESFKKSYAVDYIIFFDYLDAFTKYVKNIDETILISVINSGAVNIMRYIMEYELLDAKKYNIENLIPIHLERNRLEILKLLSTKYEIRRYGQQIKDFNDSDESSDESIPRDLLYNIIEHYHDWETLEFVVNLGMNITDLVFHNTDYNVESILISPLLAVLDSANAPKTIKEFIISQYDISDEVLLYWCATDNLGDAIMFLISSNNYNDKILYNAIIYTNDREIKQIIVDALQVELPALTQVIQRRKR